jgi:methylated-DNA-[protein]-cysteine S-methyltransferase
VRAHFAPYELVRVPYGTTATYGEIAVVVPCHQVIGSGAKLGSYAGGIERKQRLLALEDASVF